MARGHGDQVDTNFTRGAPYKIWEGKKCPKFGAIFDNFWHFDREYLRNGSTYRKSEKYLINYISSPIRWRKIGGHWSTNQKVIDARVHPPKWIFFGILNFSRKWVLDNEIFTHGRHSSRLTHAHHKHGRGSQKNFKVEDLKLGLKFYIWGLSAYNFGRSRPTLTILYQGRWLEA